MIVRFLLLFITATSLFAQVDVLTRRNDNLRSGVNAHEAQLTQDNVRKRFGKLWTLYADAKIMEQPLYVSNLAVPAANIIGSTAKTRCASGCNAVIFATMKGTLYAYMADQQPTTQNDTLLWATYLSDNTACRCTATGPQNGSGNFDMWGVDDPWWGILSTPVIDRANDAIYVVTWTNDQEYRVYKLRLSTGQIQAGPIVVQGSINGQLFAAHTNGWIQRRKQRAGLLLSNGLLYVAFGGDDEKNLSGWLFVYDAVTLAMKTVWSPTGTIEGGIWMAGDAPAVDEAGYIYLQSGNGDLDPANGHYGDSILKLKYQNGLTVAGFFAPCNQMLLDRCDLDQGSAGAVLFNEFVVGGGKDGRLYLMRRDKMPGYQPGPYPPTASDCMPGEPDCTNSPDLIQKWQAATGHIHGAPVVWHGPNQATWLYVMGEGDNLKAYPFENGKFNVAGMRKSVWKQPTLTGATLTTPQCQTQANHGAWMPGGYLGVSSNGETTGTGVVWALVPANGDANSCRGVKGMLMAFDAQDVTKEIWRSQGKDVGLSDTKDSFGLLSRFNPPTIANGKVFVGTAGDAEPLQRYSGPRPAPGPANYYLAVYGLK
jgi:hypothetical protein